MDTSRRDFLGRVALVAAVGTGTPLFADRGVGVAASLEGGQAYDVTETLTIESFDGTTIEATCTNRIPTTRGRQSS